MKIQKTTNSLFSLPLVMGLVFAAALGGLASVLLPDLLGWQPALILLAILLGVWVLGPILLPLCVRRPAIWVAGLLLALALVPNSSVITEVRIGAADLSFYNLFTRYLGGILSTWDILLLVLLGLILAGNRRFRLLGPLSSPNRLLLLICGLWILAALNGLAHATAWRYGYTNIKGVVQQALPAVYLLLSYFLTRAVLERNQDIDLLMRTLDLCNIIILIQGMVLLVQAQAGLLSVMRGFLGIPIVLYDQLTFLSLGVNVIAARLVFGQRVRVWHWIIFVGGVFFLLASTRRLILFTMLLNFVVIWFLGRRYRGPAGQWFRSVVFFCGVTAIAGAIAFTALPQLPQAVSLVIQSFDLTSDVGVANAGQLRMAQIENLFQNLNAQGLLSYIFGSGFGTQWYEFVSMGLPTDRGTTAYTEAVLTTGVLGWWPNFHLSYIALFYRYGVGGGGFLLLVGLVWFKRWFYILRDLAPVHRPLALVVIILGLQLLVGLGDTYSSAYPAMMGIWLAVLETVPRQNSMEERALPHPGCSALF